jgi:hypothetical protein
MNLVMVSRRLIADGAHFDNKTNIDDCFIIAKRFALNRVWRAEYDDRLSAYLPRRPKTKVVPRNRAPEISGAF